MARLDSPDANDLVIDALGLLARDHSLIEELFRQFNVAGDQQLDPLARRICKMLRIHAQILDEIFYPVARRALHDHAPIDAAERAHAEAKRSIMLIESMTSEDAAFRPTVNALADEFRQHVAREEGLLLPKVRESKLDLLSVGQALAERRDTLMDVLGLHADDEEAAVYPDESSVVALAAAQRQR
jgi:iron-sulfur cluster repair protein YtfE (RIC family)